jgi:hypothetical protein
MIPKYACWSFKIQCAISFWMSFLIYQNGLKFPCLRNGEKDYFLHFFVVEFSVKRLIDNA